MSVDALFARTSHSKPPASPPNRHPAACPDGFYSNRTRATSLADCIAAPVGQASRAGATAPEKCRPGSFAEREASARCTPCEAGTHQESDGATACEPCEGGAYCKEGASQPTPCPGGRFSSSRSLTSATGCELCTLGHACALGSSTPQPCAAGRFGATTGLTSRDCTGPCVEGYYCGEGGTSNTSHPCRESRPHLSKEAPMPLSSHAQEHPAVTTPRAHSNAALHSTRRHPPSPAAGRYNPDIGGASLLDCLLSPRGAHTPFAGATAPTKCAPGFHQPSEGGTRCEPCTAGSHQPEAGAAVCLPCQTGKHSSEAAAQCALCADGYYRPHANSSVAECAACSAIAGVGCRSDATIETFSLNRGRWRLSTATAITYECPRFGNWTSCRGGADAGEAGDGYCAEGYHGPRCELCADAGRYRDEASGRCTDCPDATWSTLVALAVVLGVALVLGGLWLLYAHPPRALRPVSRLLKLAAAWTNGQGWAKLKIVLAFNQCVGAAPDTFLVRMPAFYTNWMKALDWVELDWAGVVVPAQCLGSFRNRMMLTAAAPFALALVALLLSAAVTKANGQSLKRAPQRTLPFALLIAFACAPSTSRSIFTAWDCIGFSVSDAESHYFLRLEPTMRCESDEHGRLINVALVLMAIWPVGAVLLFGGLGLRVRRRLLEHTPDAFTRATRFLHRDFRREMWFWAAVELAVREVLTGWVLLVPADEGFRRVVIGLLVSLASLTCTVALRPYLRDEDNFLASVAQLVLVALFTCCSWIKVFEDVGERTTPAVARSVFGFESTDALAAVLLFFIFAMLVLMVLAAYFALRRDALVQTIRLRGSNAQPELTVARGQAYHTFNSHIWSTGQDQAATIKRQLQRLLPEIRVFLGAPLEHSNTAW